MSSIHIVATADNHLGRHHARMSPTRLEERRERLRSGFGAVVEFAVREGADLLVQAGDLFDTPSPTNADLLFVAGALRRLEAAGVAVCAVGGNHDTPSGRTVQGGVAPLSPLASLAGVVYFGAPELSTHTLNLGGRAVCVGGLTPLGGPRQWDPFEALASPAGEDVEIFVTHGALEGHSYGGAPEPVLRRAAARALPRLRLAVAGHIHRHIVERAGHATLLAPGATEWLTHGETGAPAGFVSLRYDGERISDLRHVRTQPQPRAALELDLERLQGDAHEAARTLIERHATDDTLMKLTLRGGVGRDAYVSLRLGELRELGERSCHHFELDTAELYLRDDLAPDVARGVKVSPESEIATVAEELIRSAESEERRAALAEARDELLRRRA
jgi:DNA repair exonuclease SbcCD nuclease subunit